MMALQDIYKKPVLQLMAYPADQRCLLTNNSIPNLDEYYRSAVGKDSFEYSSGRYGAAGGGIYAE